MGQDPGNVVWRQIKTDKFRIIYDQKFEEEAQRFAALVDYSTTLTGNTINQPPRKVNIVLHNRNAISNGFVTLCPSRIELFTTPPQDIYGQEWMEQLAIHEGRHWSQLTRMDKAGTRFLHYILGENGWAIASAQAGSWFLEGDAVTTETSLSESGRGRIPSFEMGYRTIQLTTGNPYPFRESVFGSFEHYIPSYYELGYLMVAYNRVKYGPELWENVMNDIAKYPVPDPFNYSLKRQIGMNRKTLYRKTFMELDSLWRNNIKGLKYTPYQDITVSASTLYTSYRSPLFYNDKILALKSGLEVNDEIVLYDAQKAKEQIILTIGSSPSSRITLLKDLIFYDEYRTHVRWGNESYSIIKAYDIKHNKSFEITHKSRYFAPCPSPTGTMLAVVENDIKGNNYLALIHPLNGKLIARYETPNNGSIQLPSWNAQGTEIVCTSVDTAGKKLIIFNLSDSSWKCLLIEKRYDITQPKFFGKFIIFNATYSGIDNIYALDTASLQVYQLTSAQFGAFDCQIDVKDSSMLYSNYGFSGYKVVGSKLKKMLWLPRQEVKNVSLNLSENLKEQEPVQFNRSDIKYTHYESRSYNKYSHLLNIHSWMPLFPYSSNGSLEFERILPGYYIMSQNLLSTVSIMGGQGIYKGNLYNQLEIDWMGWWPVFQFGIQQGDTLNQINVNKGSSEKDLKAYVGVNLPFNLSRGSMIASFTPGFQYQYRNSYYQTSTGNIAQGENKAYYNLSFSMYQRLAPRDIVPRSGFMANAIYVNPITGKKYFSSQTAISLQAFLPGLFKHHAFNFSYSSDNQNAKYYLSTTLLNPPRGFISIWDSIKPFLKNVQIASIDYYFPVLYNGFTFLKVIYFKRFAASVYANFATTSEYQASSHKFEDFHYNSIGYQFFTDFYLFFMPFSIRLGYNYSYTNKRTNAIIEPFIRLNVAF
jgi:hypothetical protein